MRRLRILIPLSIVMPLAGCATSGSVDRVQPPVVVTPEIPPVPADVLACRRNPVDTPDRALDAGETERLWKTDRAALAEVNACFRRLICQYQDVRVGIGRAETKTCEEAAKPPARGKLLRHLKGKGAAA
jgi:hypothetical protein